MTGETASARPDEQGERYKGEKDRKDVE